MSLRDDLLGLLADRGIAPSRAVRAALTELLTVVAEHNPDREPDDDAEDEPVDDVGLAVRRIACPWCGETVAVELDLGGGEQDAVQDCEVCCRPIHLMWSASEGRLADFRAGPG